MMLTNPNSGTIGTALKFRACTTPFQPVRTRRTHRRAALDARAEVFQQGSAWVTTRSSTLGRRYRTKGVVHFIGGAFAGAAPQVLYSLMLDMLAKAGYTVVATPYAVTFQHLQCAAALQDQFLDTVQALGSGDRAWMTPPGVPILGVGHSNGSLMHLLIGSSNPGATAGNALLSFNNKQVQDAIPIPGFLGTLSPTIRALREGSLPIPVIPPPVALPDAPSLLAAAASLLPPSLGWNDAGQISRAALALEQVGTVFGEVGDGVTDFTPTPSESRELIRQGYRPDLTPTLLVRFSDDGIDETPEMHAILQSAAGGGGPAGNARMVVLPGTHVTPCGSDIRWQTGDVFSPVDALVQLGKWQAQADMRRLSDEVVAHLDAVVRSRS